MQPLLQSPATFPEVEAEQLTASEWAKLLEVTPRAIRMAKLPSESKFVRGGIAQVFKFADLPERWRFQLEGLKRKHAASSYGSLVSMSRVETRWAPQREWGTYPEATRITALKRKAVMEVFYAAIDAGREKREANVLARAEHVKQFGKPATERTIRNWEKQVEKCGGIDFAPLEAYCHGKSTAHVNARREVRLQIPQELIQAFAAKTLETEHISGAYHDMVMAWQNGRAVAGLGENLDGRPFPYTLAQLRDYAAPTAARRLSSHGKARGRREALPSMRTDTASLRRCELIMLDDTRIDIIATRDSNGDPVELKSYWLIDVASRRIEGFVLREAGNIRANDVDTLIARVLRNTGIAAMGSGYKTRIKFERGTVACSPARKSFLLGTFPQQLEIDTTAIDGGKNHPADFKQSASGHWMGKGHIESFMRTLAFFLEGKPGQRGGDYRRQPAQLGLSGKERETGALNYDLGSRIAEAALQEYANRALEWIETGELAGDVALRRLKVDALYPVSWVERSLCEFVAYYNSRTDHRMEGFARIEYIDPESGAKKWRMESPDERAAVLDRLSPTQRISASDCAMLLDHRCEVKTVRAATASPGVSMDLEPWKGLRFWKPGSITCQEAAKLTTLEVKRVVVYDPEAIKLWAPGQPLPELHIMSGMPGEPGARYVETLPLCDYADRTDAEAMARELAKTKSIEARHMRDVLRLSAPTLAKRLTDAKENVQALRGIVTTINSARLEAEPSEMAQAIERGEENSRLDARARDQATERLGDKRTVEESLYEER